MHRVARAMAVSLGAVALLTPPLASGAPTATGLQVVQSADSVRVVVALSGGPVGTREGMVGALDAGVSDGRAAVAITAARARPGVVTATGGGVTARLAPQAGRARVAIVAPPGRFAFLSYRAARRPDRLVIRLWRADVTGRAEQRLNDGCLRLTGWSGGRGRASARGRELRPLFEHSLVLSLRDGQGRRLARRAVTAEPGRFRPDFSGYVVPGRFAGALAYSVPSPRRAMLQAWVTSARDGSLECLVRVPVVLYPRAA